MSDTTIMSRAELQDRFRAVLKQRDVVAEELDWQLICQVPSAAFEFSPAETGIVCLIGAFNPPEETDTDHALELVNEVIADLTAAHRTLPKEHPILLIISSQGGSVEYGLAIISAIKRIRREGRVVNCHVAGFAFSMAHDIVQHCDYRTIEDTGSLMLHEASWSMEGSTSEQALEVQFSKKLQNKSYEDWSSRTGKPPEFYRKKLSSTKTWYLDASEALAEGLVDAILPTPGFTPPKVAEPRPPRTRRNNKKKEDNGPTNDAG